MSRARAFAAAPCAFMIALVACTDEGSGGPSVGGMGTAATSGNGASDGGSAGSSIGGFAGNGAGGAGEGGSAAEGGGASGGNGGLAGAGDAGAAGGGGSNGGSAGGGGQSAVCAPYPAATTDVISVTPDQAQQLPEIVANAAAGSTIALADGIYDLSSAALLHFTTPGVTLRSASGKRDAVVLDAGYVLGEIALIAADDVTLADLTLQRAFWHPIHVTGRSDANIKRTLLYNLHVLDPGQQAIKVNPSPEGFYVDEGTLACSRVELTDAGRSHVTDCYTGGIDAHSAWGWVVRDSSFEGFWCEAGLSEHAVHFWVSARDTLVERNVIVDCARGIGFGLGETGNGKSRTYPDAPCPSAAYLGHIDGIIRNNFVVATRAQLFASAAGFDSGIALEQACGTQVYHNSIAALAAPFASIEYRWSSTQVILKNNLLTHALKQRDGANADVAGNLTDAALTHFRAIAAADLHLMPDSSAIDSGVVLPAGIADEDIDQELRGEAPDVGADELR